MAENAERSATFAQLHALSTSQLIILAAKANAKHTTHPTKLELVEAIMRALGFKPDVSSRRIAPVSAITPKREITADDIALLHELIQEEAVLLRNTADCIEALIKTVNDPSNLARQVASELRYTHSKTNLARISRLEHALDAFREEAS